MLRRRVSYHMLISRAIDVSERDIRGRLRDMGMQTWLLDDRGSLIKANPCIAKDYLPWCLICFISPSVLVVHEVGNLVERRAQVDNVVHPLEVADPERAVARRVALADELLRGADDAVVRRHDERRDGQPRRRRVGGGAVLHALEHPVGDDLELQAEVDDEGVGHGLHPDPVAPVGDLEAGDRAGEEDGDEVPVAVRRQAQRPARVRARRIAVDVEGHAAAADVPLEVVRPEPHALAEQAQYLHGQASCQRGVIPDNLPAAERGCIVNN
ncbi:hypothetical protein PVAP13_3NG055980 [Panicum virgatum]|uniref:Uncharacterized protein n=1 Tax=Panicum virgatum TaxID=38727 RepID=A0A8T0TU37_PANVG|nr:hypothetical protein PVAP13_3NG055980 [Panicum virgatum]